MIDQNLAGLLMVLLLPVLLLVGTPIGLSLAACGIFGLFLTRGWMPLEFLIGTFSYSYTANLAFIVLPLFLFMGHMTFVTGVSERAFAAAQKLIGNVGGGLGMATVAASAGFGLVCGSSVASASTIGKIAIPEMLKRGYAPSMAAAVVAAGGTLGVLIPPSGVLVVYSIATQTSLVDLFLAAFVPGLVTAIVYAALVFGMVLFKPSLGGTRQPEAPGGKVKALLASWEILLLAMIVMGGIYLGVATPTESAAIGALVATLFVLRQKRGNRLQMVRTGLQETGAATSSIFLLIIGAGLFSMGLATTQIPVLLANWAVEFSDNRYLVLLLILIPFFILGMFVDGISMMLLTLPIVFPVITKLGFDPIWFGIVVTKTVEIGLLTPPVGLNVFVVRNVAPEIPLADIFRGCVPFVIVEVLLVGALILWPGMTTVLMQGR
jgi:hypothetical protein